MNYLMLGANRIMNRVKEGIRKFWSDESGMGTVEVILIIVGICTPQKRRILCGNFCYRS